MNVESEKSWDLGCILLGLFWLISYSGLGITEHTEFQFRKERSFWKRRWPGNYSVCTCAGPRVGFPAKNFPKERVLWLFRVNRIPQPRSQGFLRRPWERGYCIPFIPFILLLGAEWMGWYSVHSENGITPKRTQIPSIPSIPIPGSSQKNANSNIDVDGDRNQKIAVWRRERILFWERLLSLKRKPLQSLMIALSLDITEKNYHLWMAVVFTIVMTQFQACCKVTVTVEEWPLSMGSTKDF